MHLGFFDNEDDAAMAVDIVYKHLYGDFYNPNIPGGLHLSGFSS